MSSLNLDAGKDVIVDVGSNGEEIELSFDEIINRRLVLRRYIYILSMGHL